MSDGAWSQDQQEWHTRDFGPDFECKKKSLKHSSF